MVRRFLHLFCALGAMAGWFYLYWQNVLQFAFPAFGPVAPYLQQYHLLQRNYLLAGGGLLAWFLWALIQVVWPGIWPGRGKRGKTREDKEKAPAVLREKKKLAQGG